MVAAVPSGSVTVTWPEADREVAEFDSYFVTVRVPPNWAASFTDVMLSVAEIVLPRLEILVPIEESGVSLTSV